MGFLKDLFGGSEIKSAALKQPNKGYISFADVPMKELNIKLGASVDFIDSLTVLNAHASKKNYLEGCFHYGSSNEPVYFIISHIVNDKPVGTTAYYQIDFTLFKALMQKTGKQL